MPKETEDEKKRREQAEALKRNQTEFTVGTPGIDVIGGAKPKIRKTVEIKAEAPPEETSPLGAAAAAAKKRREQAAAMAPKK